MDNLKTNKILAGFLLAGLLAMGGGKIAEILVPDQALDENAYPVEIKQVADSGQATTPVNQGPEPILALLASADIEAGIKVAKKCTACHEFDADGKNKTGPMLWNIVDASKGMKDGFNYSDALVGMGGAWDYEALNAFLYKPKAYIKGTKMNFSGLKKPSDRANMIAYLRSLADTPVALPTEAQIDVQEVSIQ
jgi:cytochrome c